MGFSVGVRVCGKGHLTGQRFCGTCGADAEEVLARPAESSEDLHLRRIGKSSRRFRKLLKAMDSRPGDLIYAGWRTATPPYSRELRQLRNATKLGGSALGFRMDLGVMFKSGRN